MGGRVRRTDEGVKWGPSVGVGDPEQEGRHDQLVPEVGGDSRYSSGRQGPAPSEPAMRGRKALAAVHEWMHEEGLMV